MVDLPELPSESTASIGEAIQKLEESFQVHRAERLKELADSLDSNHAREVALTELKLIACAYADSGVEWDTLLPLINERKLAAEDVEIIKSAHRVSREEWEMSRYIYDCNTPGLPLDASSIQRNIYHLVMSKGSMRRFEGSLLHGMPEGKLASEIRRHSIEILRKELAGLEEAGCFKSFDVGTGKFWGIPVLPPEKEPKDTEDAKKDEPQEESPQEVSEEDSESEDSPTSPPEISPEDMKAYQEKIVSAMREMGSHTCIDEDDDQEANIRFSMDEGELHRITEIDPGLLSVVLTDMVKTYDGKFFLEGHTTEGVSIWALDEPRLDEQEVYPQEEDVPLDDEEEDIEDEKEDEQPKERKKRAKGSWKSIDIKGIRRSFVKSPNTTLFAEEPILYLRVPFETLLEFCEKNQWNGLLYYFPLFRCWKLYFSKNDSYPDGAWFVSRPLSEADRESRAKEGKTDNDHIPIFLGKTLQFGLKKKIDGMCAKNAVAPLSEPTERMKKISVGFMDEDENGVYCLLRCGDFPEYGFIQSQIRDGYCYIQPDGEFYRCGIPLPQLVEKCKVGETWEERTRFMSFWLELEIQKREGEAEPVEWEDGQTVWMTIKRHRIADLRDKITYALEKPGNSIMSAVNVSRQANIYPVSGCLKVLREMVAAGKLYSYSLSDSAKDFAVSLAPIDSGSFPHYTLGQGALLILTTIFDQGNETKCDKDAFLEMPEKDIIARLIELGKTSVPISKNVDGKVSRMDVPTEEFVPQQASVLWDRGILVRYDVKGERHWGIPEYFRGQEYFIETAFKDGKDFPLGVPPFIKIRQPYESQGGENAS